MRLVAGLIAGLLLGAAAQPFKQAALADRAGWPEYEEYVALPPPKAARMLAMGQRELAADINWVRALQYRSERVANTEFIYLSKFIDNILALDPKFKRVYTWAAFSVTHQQGHATQKEMRMSVRYLERGIEEFPDDGELYWLAGLRYGMDLRGDTEDKTRAYRERAATLLEQAMRKPNANPHWPTMAAELRTRLGQKDRAIRDLREMILTTENKQARKRMLAKFGYLVDSIDVADELERAAEEFKTQWKAQLPYVPATLYVLVGPEPPAVIDFDELATDRDLFGLDLFEPLVEVGTSADQQ
jgi:hypothetical protein